jgi:hypothetical protein
MEYEESINLATGFYRFSRFSNFHGKKHDFSDNFFSVCHAPLSFAKIVTTPTAFPLQAKKLKFWLS